MVQALRAKGILAGIDLGALYEELDHHLLIAVTEKRTIKQMDSFVQALQQIV